MRIVPQFRDLTEVTEILGGLDTAVKEITTEFAFVLLGPHQRPHQRYDVTPFKPISQMTNWWNSHRGQDRVLTFYWAKFPGKENLLAPPHRLKWCHAGETDFKKCQNTIYSNSRTTFHLAAGGCGFKIAEPPVLKEDFFKFFTLLRMPIEPGKIQLGLLKRLNFRLIDIGSLASFWVNGWDPAEYTVEKEKEFFKDKE